MAIDLHIHTNFSDGTDSPDEIIEKSEEIGLNAISITDHETVKGLEEITKTNIEVIKGVEISAKWDEMSKNNSESGIHILLYFVKEDDTDLNTVLKELRKNKISRNYQIIEKLNSLGVEIDIEDLKGLSNQVLGRPHIAKLLVKNKYVDSIPDAFSKYLGNGMPAYIDTHQIHIHKLMEIAEASKTIPVLAHPHTLNPKKNMLVDKKWINKGLLDNLSRLVSMGLMGIETYYSSYNPSTRKELSSLAKELGILETGGSDYHGDIKLGLHLGTGWEDKPLEVPDELLEKLKEKYESIN